MEYRVSGTFEVRVEAKNSDEAVENALIQVSNEPQEYLDVDTIICEEQEVKADLRRKDDEGEDEGLKAIREHENCIDAENQENFCN